MAHDPLCFWSTHIELVPEALGGYSHRQQERLREQQNALCNCDFIAQVRADERARFRDVLLDGTFGYDVDLANSDAQAFFAEVPAT